MTNPSRKLALTDDETLADVIECLTAEMLNLEIKLLRASAIDVAQIKSLWNLLTLVNPEPEQTLL